MTSTQINHLNIGLMIVSCIAAFILPFELFLFSYAVLGPLHYLTEISWLHKKNYFTLAKKDYVLLLCFGVLIFLFSYLHKIVGVFTGVDANGYPLLTAQGDNILRTFRGLGTPITFVAFGGALVMILVKDKVAKTVAFVVLGGLGLVLNNLFGNDGWFFLLFAVFLPTLIHVFIFTGAFILFGALKGRSASGIFSLVVFVACALSFFVFMPETGYAVSAKAIASYQDSFVDLNYRVFEVFFPGMLPDLGQFKLMFAEEAKAKQVYGYEVFKLIYHSQTGVVITRFIAFAYTYHYLNWFSKTSIIKWHKVPKNWLVAVVTLWIISVGLYIYSYKVGLFALYFLSFLHVYLEFPLNWLSFRGIGQELGKILKPKTA